MLAVVVCSLANTAMLIGLIAGIGAGFWRERSAVADALAGEPCVRQRTAGERPRLRLA